MGTDSLPPPAAMRPAGILDRSIALDSQSITFVIRVGGVTEIRPLRSLLRCLRVRPTSLAVAGCFHVFHNAGIVGVSPVLVFVGPTRIWPARTAHAPLALLGSGTYSFGLPARALREAQCPSRSDASRGSRFAFSRVTKACVRLVTGWRACLLYTSPSPRDGLLSRMPSSA